MLSELMRDAGLYYHNQLKSNPKASVAIDVLHSWGIQGKTIVQLGIGFHDNSFHDFIDYMTKVKGYTVAELEEARLVSKSSNGNYCDKMRNSIIIPTINTKGEIVCFDYFIVDKQVLYKYPNTDNYSRSENLYSFNLASKTDSLSVVIVTTYEDYFRLIGKGITNVVSTYLPKIKEEQLKLLKKKFKVVLTLTSQHINLPECKVYCRKNNMFCEEIEVKGFDSVVEFIDLRESLIREKLAEFDSILKH